jgi:hypothetical protein
MKLTSYCLTRHQATLANQQPTLCIKCGNSKHDLLCAVFEHPLLALLQETKEKADSTCEEAL